MIPVAACCCALLIASSARSQETNLRLRIAWGNGAPRTWQAELSISEGSFADATPLGLEPNIPGSIEVSDGKLRVHGRSPRTYDGIDVLVTAPRDALLTVSLTPDGQRTEEHQEQVTISTLISKIHTRSIDDQRNSLVVRRAPGDHLRLDFRRDALVFSPEEAFQLTITPHETGLPPNTAYKMSIQLLEGRVSRELWNEVKNVRTDADGEIAAIQGVKIPVPAREGFYDVVVSLSRPRLVPTPFVRAAAPPLPARKLQFVVVDPAAVDPEVSDWRVEFEIDPANPGWLERLRQSPLIVIPGLRNKPLHNDRSRNRAMLGQNFVELAPGGWQAYPIPVSRPGRPHILDIEYPDGSPQTLGISIVEPNAAGDVVPIGLDSGVDVPEPLVRDLAKPSVKRHRLVFWPRTSSPVLLLTNQHAKNPAVFGRFLLVSGPPKLQPATVSDEAPDERIMAAYFDKPLFPENFGASEGLDQWSKQSRDDWGTFYQGGSRLTEYLRHVGYNAAIISVVCEGSALYPSQLLQSTSRYDNGAHFSTGQDVVRKDVLELLFRLFDRRGLKLVPAIRFSTPLPELEAVLRRGGGEAVGIELVNEFGSTWLQQRATNQGLAPYYNPLDDRVQAAMLNVVAEIVDRYGHHPSFAGLSLQLGPYTFAQLPGEKWGYDDRTIGEFERQTGHVVPGRGESRFVTRVGHLRNRGRGKWLPWRAQKLNQLYDGIREKLHEKQPTAQLYLAAANSLTSAEMQSALRPTLPSRTELTQLPLLQMGFDPRLLKREGVVTPRPQRYQASNHFDDHSFNLHLRNWTTFDKPFGASRHPSHLNYFVPSPHSLPSFDQARPFGQKVTHTWLVPHVSPSGDDNRQRFVHALAAFDSQAMIDGGWMILLGQEDSLRDLITAYRRLPAKRFEDVKPSRGKKQAVTVRTAVHEGKTYCYFVNDSPWPIEVELGVDGAARTQMRSLGRKLPDLVHKRGSSSWQIKMLPYDFVAAEFSTADVHLNEWSADLPEGIAKALRTALGKKLDEIKARHGSMNKSPPLNFPNAGFDATARDGVPGWIHVRNGPDVRVISDDKEFFHPKGMERRRGRSLRMSQKAGVRQVAWVRSQPLKTPKTGRVKVTVMLKIPDEDKQPTLRMAIEAKVNGHTYYRYARLGADTDFHLKSRWQLYDLPIDDLPQAGLSDFRVGFDLVGGGTVWIDDVKVYDRMFEKNEQDELLKRIAYSKILLIEEGDVAQCQQFLESFWAQFLLEHVPPPPVVAKNPRPKAPAQPAAPPPQAKKNYFNPFNLFR